MRNNIIYYGNWVSKKLLFLTLSISILFVISSFSLYSNLAIGIICVSFASIFILSFLYLLYLHYLFSPKGKNLQNKIYNLILDYLKFNGKGKIIDIGCGNAPLSIKLAKKYPNALITGIDYWGGLWDYSKEECEKNAALEGVKDRITFQRASASSLPFENDSFDLAVSNFVFHEVGDVKNKRELLREALRVVKKGGGFVFHDLFLSKFYYGELNDLINEMKSWGIRKIEFADTSKKDFIPVGLKLPFMTGGISLIYGIK